LVDDEKGSGVAVAQVMEQRGVSPPRKWCRGGAEERDVPPHCGGRDREGCRGRTSGRGEEVSRGYRRRRGRSPIGCCCRRLWRWEIKIETKRVREGEATEGRFGVAVEGRWQRRGLAPRLGRVAASRGDRPKDGG
jgi:hypothetical protein